MTSTRHTKTPLTYAILAGVGVTVIAMMLFGMTPDRGHAQFVPVTDPTQIAIQTSLQQKELTLDLAANLAAQAVQEMILRQVRSRVRSMINGGPAFIQDLSQHLIGIEDFVANQFATEVLGLPGTANFGPTYQTNLANYVLLNTNLNYQNKFQADLQDTLSPLVLGGNVQNYYNDFQTGGWSAWEEALRNPDANTPGGFAMRTEQEQFERTTRQLAQEESELDWGEGFQSGRDASGNIVTPGAVIRDQLNGAIRSGVERISTSDEISELLIGILQTAINDALNGI